MEAEVYKLLGTQLISGEQTWYWLSVAETFSLASKNHVYSLKNGSVSHLSLLQNNNKTIDAKNYILHSIACVIILLNNTHPAIFYRLPGVAGVAAWAGNPRLPSRQPLHPALLGAFQLFGSVPSLFTMTDGRRVRIPARVQDMLPQIWLHDYKVDHQTVALGIQVQSARGQFYA